MNCIMDQLLDRCYSSSKLYCEFIEDPALVYRGGFLELVQVIPWRVFTQTIKNAMAHIIAIAFLQISKYAGPVNNYF